MITSVAVEPSLRRSGLGQELCTRLDAVAAEWRDALGFGPSVLMQVPQSNEAARWMAAKLGFREGFRGRQHGQEDGSVVAVTLGKQIGRVTWRLMAPMPPFD